MSVPYAPQTWLENVELSFQDVPNMTLAVWKEGFPSIANVSGDCVVFIYGNFSWQGSKMEEHLSVLCRRYASKLQNGLTLHVVNSSALQGTDFKSMQDQYGHFQGLGGRGECYLLKDGKVVAIWSGLGFEKNALNELANFHSLFESVYR